MQKSLAILLTLGIGLPFHNAAASAGKPNPHQKSTTCYFNQGPKTGQTEDLEQLGKPVLLGRPCGDGNGNTGISVLSHEAKEAEEVEQVAEAQQKAGKKSYSSKAKLSNTCQYNEGPKTGEKEKFPEQYLPVPLGTPCSDGESSIGVTIDE